MTLWQRIKWCIQSVEPLPEADCSKEEFRFAFVVVMICVVAVVM